MEDDKPLYVTTGKCFSFGVKDPNVRYFTSMSLQLDDKSATSIRGSIMQCKTHLGKPLSKKVFKRKVVKASFRPDTRFYEGAKEVDYFKYGLQCEVKAVLEIVGILWEVGETSLQVKVYDALVRDPFRYEHIRMVGTEW